MRTQNNLYQQLNQNNFNIFGNLANKFNTFMNDFRTNPKQAIQQLFMNNRALQNQFNPNMTAEQMVQQLMMNGQMSQEQFNFLNNYAVQFRTFLQR